MSRPLPQRSRAVKADAAAPRGSLDGSGRIPRARWVRPRLAAYLRLYPFQSGLSQSCDKLMAVTEDPDFRSEKSVSAEGGRVAVNRWAGYHHNLEEDIVAQAFSSPGQSMEDLDPEIRDGLAADALERSELIGFWVAWHLAGGFDNLERGGWHRATIFRKIHRFRATHSAHPDEFVFPGSGSTSTPPGPSRSPASSKRPAAAVSSADFEDVPPRAPV